ncbi:MAG: HAD family hydrolase [Lentisphaerota bacterium]
MLIIPIYRYAEVIFDLDGVLVDTNDVKRRNIRAASAFLGDDIAERFTAFFISHNGITRERKIDAWFHEPDAQTVLEQYNALNAATLEAGAVLPGALDLLRQLQARKVPAHIFTGGDELEAIRLCRAKGLLELVAGIHGGPASKAENFAAGCHRTPILYFGDSPFDYEWAKARQFDFVFVAGATQFTDWPAFFQEHPIRGQVNYLDEIRLIDEEKQP